MNITTATCNKFNSLDFHSFNLFYNFIITLGSDEIILSYKVLLGCDNEYLASKLFGDVKIFSKRWERIEDQKVSALLSFPASIII